MIHLSRYTYLILAFIFFSSCGLTDNEENRSSFLEPIDFTIYEQDKTGLVDSWEWVRSIYYYTANFQPAIETPGSTDSIQKLIIKEDGNIELYLNDELEWERSVDDYLERKMWGIHGDTLAISSAHVDGSESVYLRIKE